MKIDSNNNTSAVIQGKKTITSFSWEIFNRNTATKQCDKSFFEYNGTGVPKDIKWFFGVENLSQGEKKDISIRFNETSYSAYFTIDKLDRARLFWSKELGEAVSIYKGTFPYPLAVYHKRDENNYSMDILVGSDRKKFVIGKKWIIPCNPSTYDCEGAFHNLVCVNWQQSRPMKNIEVDDIVFIYSTNPKKTITFQCIVNKVNVPSREIPADNYFVDPGLETYQGNFVELQCIREFDSELGLDLESLRSHGLKGNIQGPLKVSETLSEYLDDVISQQNSLDVLKGTNKKFISKYNQRDTGREDDETTAVSLSDEALFQIAKRKSTTNPRTRTVTSEQKYRNPYIAEAAKRRAKGICQLCGKSAPFNDTKGEPYLESHHIIWLAKGGEDSIKNTVALCPNCHRKMHVINDENDIAILIEKNSNLPLTL